MTQTTDKIYVIGGSYTKNVVAEFNDNAWRRLPNLRQGRSDHNSITIGDQTMIYGGSYSGSDG